MSMYGPFVFRGGYGGSFGSGAENMGGTVYGVNNNETYAAGSDEGNGVKYDEGVEVDFARVLDAVDDASVVIVLAASPDARGVRSGRGRDTNRMVAVNANRL